MSDPPKAARTVLIYGTHDRSGPWWQRWPRAWLRAAPPAMLAAMVVGLVAAASAPRRFTSTATFQIKPATPAIVAAQPGPVAQMLTAYVDATAFLARGERQLAHVMKSPQWKAAAARAGRRGGVVANPLDARAVANSTNIEISFTAADRKLAQVGADAAAVGLLSMLTSIDELDGRRLAVLADLRDRRAADLAELRQRPSAEPRKIAEAERAVQMISQRIKSSKQESAGGPRFTVVQASAARLSNGRQLVVRAAYAAGVAFAAVFLVALAWRSRFRRSLTHRFESGGGPTA